MIEFVVGLACGVFIALGVITAIWLYVSSKITEGS